MVSTAKPIGSVRWSTARLGTRKPDPASQRQAVKSHHQIRRFPYRRPGLFRAVLRNRSCPVDVAAVGDVYHGHQGWLA